MTVARNVAIIAAIAAAVAFLPGGGDVAAVVSRTLSLAFAAAIAWAGWWAYRRYALDLDALPPGYRALLYGAIGAVVLALAGAGKLTATTPGALLFMALLGGAILALVTVWRAHRELS